MSWIYQNVDDAPGDIHPLRMSVRTSKIRRPPARSKNLLKKQPKIEKSTKIPKPDNSFINI
jgi:hypothetical protein